MINRFIFKIKTIFKIGKTGIWVGYGAYDYTLINGYRLFRKYDIFTDRFIFWLMPFKRIELPGLDSRVEASNLFAGSYEYKSILEILYQKCYIKLRQSKSSLIKAQLPEGWRIRFYDAFKEVNQCLK